MSLRFPYLSIVIPVLNEATELPRSLQGLRASPGVEIVFVDGGSQDGSLEFLQRAGQTVLQSQRGRARQMNLGARRARGRFLLFLHADSVLDEGCLEGLEMCMQDPRIVGGAFRLKIRSHARALRIIEWGVRMRSCLMRMPYGDQGLFVRREAFWTLGGYRDLPIMEDLDLVRRMKTQGRLTMRPERITTSDRRWKQNGVLRTSLLNILLATLFFLRVPVHSLAGLHQGLSDSAHGKAPSQRDPSATEANADRAQGESSKTSPSQQVSAHERVL